MEWLPELSEFLRIKSISGDAAHGDDVKRAGEWVCARVREAGGECELVDWHGQPLAIGEIRHRAAGKTSPDAVWWGGALAAVLAGGVLFRLGGRIPDPLREAQVRLASAPEAS